MSAPELLTERERQLLTGIRELLDIPYPARWGDRQSFELVIRDRVFRLLGLLDGLGDDVTHPNILEHIKRVAARPLGYEPEPPEASP